MYTESLSERRGLELLTPADKQIYSVGISTAGLAEVRMAQESAERHIIATTIDAIGLNGVEQLIESHDLKKQIEAKLEDVRKPLSYGDETFDFIYARLVLHYLSKQQLEAALRELYRVLKKGGKLFVVVRSTECIEQDLLPPDPQSGLSTYTLNGKTLKRYFHTPESITRFLKEARFDVLHTKTYEERLCSDFGRTQLSPRPDALIEVFCSKLSQ